MMAVQESMLDTTRHARLLADMEHVCAVANVPRNFVHRSMKGYCDAVEIDFIVNYRVYRDNYAGLVLVGKDNADSRCMAMCGALVRNFIDARIMPLNTLLDAVEAHDVPDPSVLIIPNLYVSSVGKTLPAWKIAHVYDVLLQRMTSGHPTIVAVESLKGVESAYGMIFAQHLLSHYKQAV